MKAYNKKRNFKITPEPKFLKSKQNSEKSLIFVIQKHAARHLHYDLRLELRGTLKSWAVPKGPSLEPSVKRLAIHVEDHPLEYAKFKGRIPEGQYGAGTVEIWDSGTWKTEGDPYAAYKKGDLTFELKGKRLRGLWKLIRTNSQISNKESWLLFKIQDSSTATPKKVVNPIKSKFSVKPEYQKFVKQSAVPNQFSPELGYLTEDPPQNDHWCYEIKFDGYRILAIFKNETVRLFTRNGKDWTEKFPSIVKQLKKLSIKNSILDGELVAVDKKGISRFQLLQNHLENKQTVKLLYYVFDLPFYNGHSFLTLPLLERKRLLQKILHNSSGHPDINYTDHIQGPGKKILVKACKMGLEGIMAKHIDSPYEQKRSKNWLKLKCGKREEFVIGGFTKPKGGRSYFGALLLGYYDKKGNLIYAGRVGTGFNEESLKGIYEVLKRNIQMTSAFVNPPQSRLKEITWVKPKLVAELKYLEMTREGILRHPAFVGLRQDKNSLEVKRADIIQEKNNSLKLKEEISITHPDKVFPVLGHITKQELADYYSKISARILPHLINRPLTLLRCPSNTQKTCFYQKHYNKAFGKDVYPIQAKTGEEDYLWIRNKQGLMTLIQFDSIELHPWGSQKPGLKKPDRIIFDLDPDPDLPWKTVIEAAFYIRQKLKKLGLESFVKTTGGKGLHLVVPIQAKLAWEDIKSFAHQFVLIIERQYPEKFITTVSKKKRKGKIFLDYLRNVQGATAVAPYSVRARQFAPLSLPLSWEALKKTRSGNEYTISNIDRYLKQHKTNPWKTFFTCRQNITKVMFKKIEQV